MSWKIWNDWNSSLNHLKIRHFFASEFSYCLKRNRANVQNYFQYSAAIQVVTFIREVYYAFGLFGALHFPKIIGGIK